MGEYSFYLGLQNGRRSPRKKAIAVRPNVLKRIYIHGAFIRHNKVTGDRRPVISVKTSKRVERADNIVIRGASELKSSFDKPLNSGAVVWIETRAEVEIHVGGKLRKVI